MHPEHYEQPIQPWDYIAANGIGFFEGNIIKYVSRWERKGGIDDLLKHIGGSLKACKDRGNIGRLHVFRRVNAQACDPGGKQCVEVGAEGSAYVLALRCQVRQFTELAFADATRTLACHGL